MRTGWPKPRRKGRRTRTTAFREYGIRCVRRADLACSLRLDLPHFVNTGGHLFVGMAPVEGVENLLEAAGGHEGLEAGFRGQGEGLSSAHGGMGGGIALEGAGALGAKAAACVVADLTGTGVEQCLTHRICVAGGNEGNEFVVRCSRIGGFEGTAVLQLEHIGEQVISTGISFVRGGMGGALKAARPMASRGHPPDIRAHYYPCDEKGGWNPAGERAGRRRLSMGEGSLGEGGLEQIKAGGE